MRTKPGFLKGQKGISPSKGSCFSPPFPTANSQKNPPPGFPQGENGPKKMGPQGSVSPMPLNSSGQQPKGYPATRNQFGILTRIEKSQMV